MSAVALRERAAGGDRPAVKPLRCAIYTRKSSEQGLEQAFNSLDNQREAAEAYIKSQAHEGWRLLPGTYDDGGFSGGSLERPALARLLGEVRAGRVDVIVVYKVDRLTRSLADFAKLVELFDAHATSFVSVTQAFNTTSSMGRLTLNVLLSFAQFEREVTGERIRDKIAASKKKGLRVGGPVPLGYQLQHKKLVPCPAEADTVRLIFRRYQELGSLRLLLQDLDRRQLVSKAYPRRGGGVRGGLRFSKSGLSHLIRNRCYVGEVIHKGHYYPGEHEPIVDLALFEAANVILTAHAVQERADSANHDSVLKGVLFDATGRRMTATTSTSRGPLYRYYISTAVTDGRRDEAPPRFRVSAPEIEARVIEALGLGAGSGDGAAAGTIPGGNARLRQQLLDRVRRITLQSDALAITLRGDGSESQDEPPPLIVPWASKRHSARRTIIEAVAAPTSRAVLPMRGDQRARLVQGIANARCWLGELVAGTMPDVNAIARREGCSERHIRMVLNLAFLSPAIIKAAVDGELPAGNGVVGLAGAEPWWG